MSIYHIDSVKCWHFERLTKDYEDFSMQCTINVI